MTAAVRRHLDRNRSEFDPRTFLAEAIKAASGLCAQRYEQFGSAGHGHEIKPISLEDMARRHDSGALDPRPAAATVA